MKLPIQTITITRRRVLGMLVALGLPVPWSARADKWSYKEAAYYRKH